MQTRLLLLLLLGLSQPLAATAQPVRLMGGLTWGMSPDALRGASGPLRTLELESAPGFVRDELLHVSGEAVLEARGPSSRTFYFFASDRLWKTYEAFEALAYPEGHFSGFVALLRKRFGPGSQQRDAIAWRQGRTLLRALAPGRARGFYCLIQEDLGGKSRGRRRSAPP